MRATVSRYLSCPVCLRGLSRVATALRCPSGHSFDIARQGYVNLRGRAGGGDTAAMVRARAAFLGAGHYAPITAALVTAAAAVTAPGCVADLGAGTGRHLAAVLDALPGREGLALDASTAAARVAARTHPRAGAVVADAWQRLPLRDGAAAVVLDVFAPRRGPEIARVLHPDGALVVVVPTARHLGELVGALDLLTVDAAKEERLERTLGPLLARAGSKDVEFGMELDHAGVSALVGMGPSARHVTPDAVSRRIAELPDPVTVTASVIVSTWHRTPSP